MDLLLNQNLKPENVEDYVRKNIEKTIKLEGLGEVIENTEIIKVSDKIYAVEQNKYSIWFYCNEKGEVIFNPNDIAKSDFALNSLSILGYTEQVEDGTLKLFPIKKINNENFKKGKKNIKYNTGEHNLTLGVPLGKYSIETFQAREEIRILNHIQEIQTIQNANNKRNYGEIPTLLLNNRTDSQALTLSDLIVFYQNKQINNEQYEKYTKKVKKYLINQIGDENLEMFGIFIDENELNEYLQKGLIQQDEYDICMNKIEELRNNNFNITKN